MSTRTFAWLGLAAALALAIVASCLRQSTVACATNRDCAQFGNVVCLHSAGADGGLCGVIDGGLVPCATAMECLDPTRPLCDPSAHVCRACMLGPGGAATGDCPQASPVCAPTGACVACTDSSHCAAQGLSCNTTTNTCVPCTRDSDCTTGLCQPTDHHCAPLANAAFVDNSASNCSDSISTSMPSRPYCEIQAAVTKSGKTLITVRGSNKAYQAVSISPTGSTLFSVTIKGPGRVTPPATVNPSGPAIQVNSTSTPFNVTLQGLDVAGAVLCNSPSAGVGTLSVIGCNIHDAATLAGISSTRCNAVVDANLIGPNNHLGGLIIGSSSYSITNNIIFGNGTTSGGNGGVGVDSASTGTLAFNTIVQNHVSSGGTAAGGVYCGGGQSVVDSIVWHNDVSMTSKQMAGCTLSNVVVGSLDSFEGGGVVLADPNFVNASASDYHLVKNDPMNQTCCVDKATSTTPHDVDFTSRPLGAGYDVGAHEAQ